jgi:hypothetical protein
MNKNKTFILTAFTLYIIMIGVILHYAQKEQKYKVNDTGKTVYDIPCIIFVKDYTLYNIKSEYVIPTYDPEGFMIDTCRGKMF